ncbi:NeuD/PglB/VioB family sugar acetyltransferase [Enterococcus rotai]|uniref:NeuD/PglB/VioB family sugar acetyltransferase n=1 Tax=Enterococcus rotai TaxID=118060 RepID=UPI0032B3E037
MKDIVIVGAGGHGKEVAFLINKLPDYNLIGFYDDDKVGEIICNVPVISKISELKAMTSPISVVLGIAKPRIKQEIVKTLILNSNIIFPNLIDPRAELGINIVLGIGNVIMTNTTFTADINLGDFNMLNIGSTVGHDVKIGSYNSIYPSVNISGGVTIFDGSELGVGAKVIQGIEIGESAIVGAGSVVIKDVKNYEKVVGVPAKKIGGLKNET